MRSIHIIIISALTTLVIQGLIFAIIKRHELANYFVGLRNDFADLYSEQTGQNMINQNNATPKIYTPPKRINQFQVNNQSAKESLQESLNLNDEEFNNFVQEQKQEYMQNQTDMIAAEERIREKIQQMESENSADQIQKEREKELFQLLQKQ